MRAQELKVSIVTEEFEAAASFLEKIAELVKEHGGALKMSMSTTEIDVESEQRHPHLGFEVTAEAESEEFPLDDPNVVEEDG